MVKIIKMAEGLKYHVETKNVFGPTALAFLYLC